MSIIEKMAIGIDNNAKLLLNADEDKEKIISMKIRKQFKKKSITKNRFYF
ncbi:hypothetical protein CLPUN_44280 [Clostridium puniceum]|uniref:Uncharacterized protein n=1 Tax=Clostridium puniceum TaxID=29367 RepID=A0A1S8T7T1_9CLOT|nr:hypothetical protein [Clostridium puniceum]OOM73674.1 hypothetical protein CLPUN_44280 [Clostridium puniceum]